MQKRAICAKEPIVVKCLPHLWQLKREWQLVQDEASEVRPASIDALLARRGGGHRTALVLRLDKRAPLWTAIHIFHVSRERRTSHTHITIASD